MLYAHFCFTMLQICLYLQLNKQVRLITLTKLLLLLYIRKSIWFHFVLFKYYFASTLLPKAITPDPWRPGQLYIYIQNLHLLNKILKHLYSGWKHYISLSRFARSASSSASSSPSKRISWPSPSFTNVLAIQTTTAITARIQNAIPTTPISSPIP